MDYHMKRRTFLGGSFATGLALAGLNACANQSQSTAGDSESSTAGGKLVAATYQGNWEEAHRKILVPAFKKATGADVTLVPMFAVDQVARLQAAGAANSPFDVAILTLGP
jgi:putative spermidine/putrescine transport system substrate-binding protein